jgi:non-ribosomal peptide synthetase-like protein
VLRQCDGIAASVVTVVTRDDQQQLAAFVVPTARGGPGELDRGAILARLRDRLPSYMVPVFLNTIDELPRLASGKVDRRRLPEPSARLLETGRRIIPPATELERQLAALWEGLFHTTPVSVADDFFMDLGGDSLIATSLIAQLATRHAIQVSLRDIYTHPTIGKLSAHIASTARTPPPDRHPDCVVAPRRSSRDVYEGTSRAQKCLCVALQAVSSMCLYGLIAIAPLLMAAVVLSVFRQTRTPARGAVLFVGIAVVAYPLWLVLTIALKWLIVGRFRGGQIPLWGLSYCRFWLVRRLQALSGIDLLAGTPVMSLYYRLMGARIGRHCILDTGQCAAFDLIAIGDDTCIGAETQLLGYRVEDGMVHFGPIEIGSRCFVGIHCSLGLKSRMGDDSQLGDLSLLPDGVVLPAGRSWRGSPAASGPVRVPHIENCEASRRAGMFGALYLALAGLLGVILVATLVPALTLVWMAATAGGAGRLAAALLAAVPVSILSFALLVVAVKALVLRRMPPGVYRVESWLFVRKWFIDALLALSRSFLRPVYTTIYLAPWLRLLGARIGRLAEISTISQGAPDLFDIGAQSFFADGSMIGGRHFYRGHVEVARSRIGCRSFVGNNAILPIGFGLGERCLLGVLSVPPEQLETAPDGTEWLGAPSFVLPHRNKVEGFDVSVTFEPTAGLYAHRIIVDAVRILLPGVLLLLGALPAFLLLDAAWGRLSRVEFALFLPLVTMSAAMSMALGVVVVKVLVMGRFRPVVRPLWCPYVWWNEVLNGAWETVSVPMLAPLVGSPLFNVFLRWMGCRIGRWAYVGTSLFSEFDLVNIGDFAALNEGVVVQNHLFEDRIMKSSHVNIGDECTVGNMAVVLYDSEMERAASLGPLSLLMKGSIVPQATRWIGIPATRVNDAQQ